MSLQGIIEEQLKEQKIEQELIINRHLKLKSFELAKGLFFYDGGREYQQTATRLIQDAEKIYQELIKQ